jgi:hypothetical protein
MSSTARRRRSRGRGVGSRSGKAEPYRTAGGKAAGEIIGRQSRGRDHWAAIAAGRSSAK